MNGEAVIGLEVHCQLLTRTKMFCGCLNRYGAPPNTQTCPVCLGMPGVLPVMNRRALRLAARAAMAFGCTISPLTRMDRKNYYYPDLPKNYQISQFDRPLAAGGTVRIGSPAGGRDVRLTRLHLEEDAGKLIHLESGSSCVDLNRAGTPLIEIVSEPDLHTPDEAFEYLTNLKAILLYLEVSDCNMEEGSLRCDANVSVRPVGERTLGTKREIKNMNSFRNVQKALTREIAEQLALLESGGRIDQATLLWNADTETLAVMRMKEAAEDYRYFPEPDLPPIALDKAFLDEVRQEIPELPAAKAQRFRTVYGLGEKDIATIIESRASADYFEAAAAGAPDPRTVANWFINELKPLLHETHLAVADCRLAPREIPALLKLMDAGRVTRDMARKMFARMAAEGLTATEALGEAGEIVNDDAPVRAAACLVIASMEKAVAAYRGGKANAFNSLLGGVMRELKGKAPPAVARRILAEELAKGGAPGTEEKA